LLDTGNLSDHPTPRGTIRTRGLVEGMGKLGYRAVNVGERDLSKGWDEFRRRTGDAPFPFISSNIVRKDTGKPVFSPYVVLDVPTREGKTFKVGVLGVVRFNPIFLKPGPDGSNLQIVHPVEAAGRYIGEIRKKADYVVLLGALHKNDLRRILREVPGIDVALGSYGGIFSTREEREGDTLYLYSGNQGKRIGEVRLYLDGEKHVAAATPFMYYLTGRYPGEPGMIEFVDRILTEAGSTGAAASASTKAAAGAGPSAASR
jgi:2',3'-cyclic-nucleotide 2'-phosphodiesterase (5'-nucleotidase family)